MVLFSVLKLNRTLVSPRAQHRARLSVSNIFEHDPSGKASEHKMEPQQVFSKFSEHKAKLIHPKPWDRAVTRSS